MISSTLKFLISLPYQLVHALRCKLYEYKVLGAKSLPAFVISVGNISFGGSGKTPFTIALARYLSEKYQVAILSRGYKSRANHTRIFTAAEISQTSVTEIGDEAMEMLELLKGTEVKVIVAADRYSAALESPSTEVFILDDGLQHVQLTRDLEIILQNQQEKGFYRELPMAFSKADFLIKTKIDDKWSLTDELGFVAGVKYKISLRKALDLSKPIALVSAIADPRSFEISLRTKLSELYAAGALGDRDYSQERFYIREFPDHHQFTQSQVSELTCMGMNLVCTLKDYVKIPADMQGDFIPVDLSVEVTPSNLFEQIAGKIDHGKQRLEHYSRESTSDSSGF